ncbi:hypothetical protein LF1_17570 [Rubripirellula obstinata]|uniref:Uncharacterized protein n=1 Tax=Rubripirellula obstinata TaxID=406547 RepID=A0A5B1CDM9_9BACT|nr:hypothetical protein LF1_17570 [Rubripirellula obstinata]
MPGHRLVDLRSRSGDGDAVLIAQAELSLADQLSFNRQSSIILQSLTIENELKEVFMYGHKTR